MQNVGSRFSIPAVGKALKSNENTISAYINFLCDSYICTDVRNFSYENISFDNNKTECDFIAYKRGKVYGFQICYELNAMNLKHELKGFELENIAFENKFLLTYNRKVTYGEVEAVPFWEWGMSE